MNGKNKMLLVSVYMNKQQVIAQGGEIFDATGSELFL